MIENLKKLYNAVNIKNNIGEKLPCP